jgi:hypothetical protein
MLQYYWIERYRTITFLPSRECTIVFGAGAILAGRVSFQFTRWPMVGITTVSNIASLDYLHLRLSTLVFGV